MCDESQEKVWKCFDYVSARFDKDNFLKHESELYIHTEWKA